MKATMKYVKPLILGAVRADHLIQNSKSKPGFSWDGMYATAPAYEADE
jgi:hypothetical protein